MGTASSQPLTPEAQELKEAATHRAIEKCIASNNLPGMYYPLLHGADPNRLNDDNVGLLEIAVRNYRVEHTAFLLLFNASRDTPVSAGGTLAELANNLKSEAADNNDNDRVMRADAIVDLIEKPGTEKFFRLAYDQYLDKMMENEKKEKNRKYAMYFLSIVVFLHAFAYYFEDSQTNELLQMSPLLKVMNLTDKYVRRQMQRFVGTHDEV